MAKKTSTAADDDDFDERLNLPRRNGYRKATWSLVLLLLLIGAAGYGFYRFMLEPGMADLKALRARLTQSDAWRTQLRDRSAALTTERDAVRADRDAVRSQLDALRAREAELQSAVATRDALLAELTAAHEALRQQFQSEIASGDVQIEQSEGRLALRVVDRVLFGSGQAELSEPGKAVLRRIGTSLARLPNRLVQVEGHTDSLPVAADSQAQFATNWELSTARATHVVRFLQDECGVPGERLVAAGLSQFRPVGDNRTANGRRRNRRIELTLLPMPARGAGR